MNCPHCHTQITHEEIRKANEAAVLELRYEGLSMGRIADELGLSKTTVWDILDARGLRDIGLPVGRPAKEVSA